MGVRRNASTLSAADAGRVGSAFAAAYELGDERGYGYLAGLHGLPLPSYCEHGTSLFLPWHGAYLYMFERALQDQAPAIDVPWWDWSSDASHRRGLPAVFAARNVAA